MWMLIYVIYILIHTHIHTYTYTYIHIYTHILLNHMLCGIWCISKLKSRTITFSASIMNVKIVANNLNLFYLNYDRLTNWRYNNKLILCCMIFSSTIILMIWKLPEDSLSACMYGLCINGSMTIEWNNWKHCWMINKSVCNSVGEEFVDLGCIVTVALYL